MRTKLVIGLFAVSSLALPLLAQAQHTAAPAPAAHAVAPPPPTGQRVVSATKVSSTRSSASHHATVSTGSATAHPVNSKIRALDFDGIGSAPLGPHFVGPVSPGGFVNPLAATNEEVNQQRRFRNSNGIIFFGGGYGYDYTGQAYQDPDQAQDPSQGRADDQQSGGQQSGGQQPQYIFVQQVPDPRLQGKQGSTSQPSDQDLSMESAEHEPAVPIFSTPWRSPAPAIASSTSRPTAAAAPWRSVTSTSTKRSASTPSAVRPSPFLQRTTLCH
jgi:hypothetical protein